MFRITEDPSSGSFVQCLAKITKIALWTLLTYHVTHPTSRKTVPLYTVNYTQAHQGKSLLYFYYICLFSSLFMLFCIFYLFLKQTSLNFI